MCGQGFFLMRRTTNIVHWVLIVYKVYNTPAIKFIQVKTFYRKQLTMEGLPFFFTFKKLWLNFLFCKNYQIMILSDPYSHHCFIENIIIKF